MNEIFRELPDIGASHRWVPVTAEDIAADEYPRHNDDRAVDLHEEFPTPDSETLQDIWDSREEVLVESSDGPSIPSLILNRGGEKGTIFWYTGYGVSSRVGGGAREGVLIAALNPDHTVVTVDEQIDTPRNAKIAAWLRNPRPYAEQFMIHLLAMEQKEKLSPTVMTGRSKGGRVTAEIARHEDAPELERMIIGDVPSYQYKMPLSFGLRIAVLENLPYFKSATLLGQDEAEEQKIRDLDIPEADAQSLAQVVRTGLGEYWISRGIGSLGLDLALRDSLNEQPEAQLHMYHGRGNLGIPVSSTRAIMGALMEEFPDRVTYLEADARHFSEGHAPLFGRQIAAALEHDEQAQLESLSSS